MTLTEFNQAPSKASSLAEAGEDVIITRRGEGVLLLAKVGKAPNGIEKAIRDGWATPPKRFQSLPRVFPKLGIDKALAQAMLADLEISRDPNEF